ncbi:hypothetical protein R83H12_00042 [Fibrobacteria bacterium R8-3-H12]
MLGKFYIIAMRSILLALFSLCFFACIDEYADFVEIHSDGSAQFSASIYPCEPDSNFIENIKANYDSIPGLKFDSAWFSQRDSLYSLNFRLSFENLLSWQGNKKFEKDLVGNISLKKIDTLKNGYSFERIINPTAESEDGSVVPEESISPFAIEQIIKNDSAFWEYALILPQGAVLINSEPIEATYISKNKTSNVVNWRFYAGEAISKRILLKADFSLPAQTAISRESLIGIAVGCIVMLLAIILLFRKLKKLSSTLKELKNTEKNLTGE